MFECDKCGACCRSLKRSELYSKLDRGDGICKYLNDNLCSIYDIRPVLCRVDECYDLYFKELYSREEYYRLNYEACENLKREETVIK